MKGTRRLSDLFPNMDRETILRQLAEIEDRVERTERQIATYRETVSRLEHDGRDAAWAELMLRQCEEVLALHLTLHAKLIDRLSRSAN
jgi:hypothetical protein